MIILSTQEYIDKAFSGQEFFCYVLIDEKLVLNCEGSDAKIDEAIKRGYRIQNVPMKGGGIVMSGGDIAFGFMTTKIGENYRKIVLGHIANKLKEKGLNAECNNNDVTVDGYKVVGYAQSDLSNQHPYLCVAIAVSMNVNLDDIKAICTKDMKKIPGSLSDYGITREDMVEIFNEIESNIIRHK